METKVINIKESKKGDIYIGRPTLWGNPFTHLKTVAERDKQLTLVGSRWEAIEAYRELILERLEGDDGKYWRHSINRLKGKRLSCWCKPKRCHGDILAALADGTLSEALSLDLSAIGTG